ncbi:MAG: hypothetical protein LBR36_08825 [Bacteroidales bacterium]|jgi:hypothetical protein|nr:hypothetical protein [Bacteroidales bacterium]
MKDSIKKEVDKVLKETNPNLFDSKWGRLLHFINDHNKWYVIVLLIFTVFFGLQFINVPLLNFIHIDDVSVKSLIDNRTTNIVTMISVTFAIIGFLIANLAIKESFTYNILFKKSTFFPVSFIALSLIASFIILSTIKSAIPLDYQTRTLFVGTFLILLVIFLIGFLFTRLVKFTNQKYLLELTKKELISESRHNLLLVGRKIISAKKISELGFAQYSMAFYMPKTKGNFQISKDHSVITDIKLHKLKKLAQQIDINDFFAKDVCLYRKLTQTNEDGFFFVEENKLNQNSTVLNRMNNCVVTSAIQTEQKNEAKEYIIQKLKENIKANNDKLVEEYFDMLLEMFRLQQDFKFSISNKEEDITVGIKTDVFKMIDKAISSNSLESFYAIDGFCVQLLNLSISNKNISHFKEYLDLARYYYILSYNYYEANNAMYGKIYEQCSERAAMRIREVFLLLNFYFDKTDKADIQTKEMYNDFKYIAFSTFSQLLYNQVMNKDIKSFSYTLNQLEQGVFFGYHYDKYDFIVKLLRQEYSESELKNYKVGILPYRYFQHTVLGIKYWLFYLYENNQINLDELNEFVVPVLQIINEKQITPEYWEIELLFNYLNSNALSWYLNWQHWDYVTHKDGKAFTMPSVFDWIFTGFVIDAIKQGSFSNNFNVDTNLLEKQNPQNKSLLINTLKESLNRVKQNERWQEYFNNQLDTTQKIENQLNQINATFETQKAKEIVSEKLIPEKVQSFKSNFSNGWKDSKFIRKIFEHFGNIQKDETTDNKLFLVGLRAFLEKGKHFFLHISDNVYGIDDIAKSYGRNVSSAEDRLFFHTILKSKTEKVFNSVDSGLEKSISKLRKSKHTPTAIFLDYNPFFICQNEKWSNEKIIDFSNSTYDGVPVFYVKGNLLGNRFIVADFGKAFIMLYREIENAFDNVLKIDVIEISDEMANGKLQKEPEKWKNIDGQKISDEDALNYIKTSIILDYEVRESFEINNKSAFEVGLIDNNNKNI